MSTFDVKNIRGKNMSRLYAYFIIPDESDLSWANRSQILRQMQTSAEIDSKVHVRASTSFMRQEREIVARIDAKRSSEILAQLMLEPERPFHCRTTRGLFHPPSIAYARNARMSAHARARNPLALSRESAVGLP